MPLVMELRQAWFQPVSIRTPKFPNGRLCHLALAAVCADRPAAIGLIGASSQARKSDVCTRCHATHDRLAFTQGKSDQTGVG
jgi:hypothetical protein